MTDDQREARILSWHRHDPNTPIGQCVVPIHLVERIARDYQEMGFEVQIQEYVKGGNGP